MQPQYDGIIVQFKTTLPAPPRELLYEHFKQAVLANMKGAGQPRDLDFDPTEDAQTMFVFEKDSGKEWLETRMAEKLALYEEDVDARNGHWSSHAREDETSSNSY